MQIHKVVGRTLLKLLIKFDSERVSSASSQCLETELKAVFNKYKVIVTLRV